MTSKITVGVCAATMGFLLLSNLPAAVKTVNADSGVAINSNNFPDENFRKYVSENCDGNHDGYLSNTEITSTPVLIVVNFTHDNIDSIARI